ncbi:ras small monomeric GTPase [Aspergillus sclerotiicarbonarius CBS 121057]|uniref:Ras small monomeric GTPase n=1 Tax=Aspergillus sclerotiicarbonarius (strain CBS 121057 / IBT 28362) TaxID=1448318 RepID=A0A319EJL4_ASPSB|nr:ras small monomeric GTPase [Aspergillus sclerotiicarbonarius CBS 121057]
MADSPDKISITICGDGGCGKSSITLRLVRSQWIHEYDPTIEDSYSVTRVIDGVPYFLSITDTAGQEEYRGLWAASNLRSDAFLLVYDITNRASLGALDYFMEMIDIETEQRAEDNDRLRKELGASAEGLDVGMPPPVKIVAGNKCDLKDSRVIGAREGLEYARKHGCGFMETSAREMVNIEETFALRRVVEARREHYQKAPTAQQTQAGESSTAAKGPAGAVVSKEATEASSKRAQQRQSGLRGLFKGKQARQDAGQTDNLKPDGPVSEQKRAGPAKPSIWRRMRCC